jgi:hypothetical protein
VNNENARNVNANNFNNFSAKGTTPSTHEVKGPQFDKAKQHFAVYRSGSSLFLFLSKSTLFSLFVLTPFFIILRFESFHREIEWSFERGSCLGIE